MKNSGNSIMKLLVLASISMMFFIQVSAQTGKPDFTGTWTLNETKSDFGNAPFRMAASAMTVKQEGNNLTIERTIATPDGQEMKMSGKYTLDGKETENVGMMDMKTKSKVNWAADNKSFTIASVTIFNMNGDSMEMKSTEVWNLDGNGLKINATNTMPEGDMKTVLIYDKK